MQIFYTGAMKKFLFLILFAIYINVLVNATETCSTEAALKILDKVIHDERLVRNYFRYSFQKDDDHDRCSTNRPNNCADVMHSGFKTSGVYTIYLKSGPSIRTITVYCDMETDGGGWTVFQRREKYPERQQNFTKKWKDYAYGFGNIRGEFWLGNEYLHLLTTEDDVVLRFDLKDFEKNSRFATYKTFVVDDRDHDYKVKVAEYSGDAGDSFSGTNGLTFVTIDRNDVNDCAKNYRGGWWYGKCHSSNLNGEYLRGKHESYANGVNWYEWLGHNYSLKWTEMKIRPKSFK